VALWSGSIAAICRTSAMSAALEEGVAVAYDVAADFAVLCANCHRMIHRTDDPSNLSLFRAKLTSNKT
jgi:predicted HNH restriction endonuclease